MGGCVVGGGREKEPLTFLSVLHRESLGSLLRRTRGEQKSVAVPVLLMTITAEPDAERLTSCCRSQAFQNEGPCNNF